MLRKVCSKRAVALLLVCAAVFIGAAAAQYQTTPILPEDTVKAASGTEDLWSYDKASRGVEEDASVTSSVEGPIIVYRTNENGLEQGEVVDYLVIEDGQIVGISEVPLAYPDCITTGEMFAPELNQFFSSNPAGKSLALIYDGNKLYAYDGNTCGLILQSGPKYYEEYGNVLETAQAFQPCLTAIGVSEDK